MAPLASPSLAFSGLPPHQSPPALRLPESPDAEGIACPGTPGATGPPAGSSVAVVTAGRCLGVLKYRREETTWFTVSLWELVTEPEGPHAEVTLGQAPVSLDPFPCL